MTASGNRVSIGVLHKQPLIGAIKNSAIFTGNTSGECFFVLPGLVYSHYFRYQFGWLNFFWYHVDYAIAFVGDFNNVEK